MKQVFPSKEHKHDYLPGTIGHRENGPNDVYVPGMTVRDFWIGCLLMNPSVIEESGLATAMNVTEIINAIERREA